MYKQQAKSDTVHLLPTIRLHNHKHKFQHQSLTLSRQYGTWGRKSVAQMQTRTITIYLFRSFKTELFPNYLQNSIPASQRAHSVCIRKKEQVSLFNEVTRLQRENLWVKRKTLQNAAVSGTCARIYHWILRGSPSTQIFCLFPWKREEFSWGVHHLLKG